MLITKFEDQNQKYGVPLALVGGTSMLPWIQKVARNNAGYFSAASTSCGPLPKETRRPRHIVFESIEKIWGEYRIVWAQCAVTKRANCCKLAGLAA